MRVAALVLLSLGLGCLLGAMGFSAKVEVMAGPSEGLSPVTLATHGDWAIVEYRGAPIGVECRERFLKTPGRLRPLTTSALNRWMYHRHWEEPPSIEEHIAEYIALDSAWETIVLTSAVDIPGFKPEDLDPDIRHLSLQPVTYSDSGQTIHVRYTWTNVEGVVKRYRFRVSKHDGIVKGESVVLQRMVGLTVLLL